MNTMKSLVVLFAALACTLAAPWAHWAMPAVPHGYTIVRSYHPVAYSAPIAYSPIAYSAPVVHSARLAYPAPLAGVTKTQYHAQDELGQASYGHSEASQSHHAVQDAFGNKAGSFSYASPDGRIMRTNYVADALGYRTTSRAFA